MISQNLRLIGILLVPATLVLIAAIGSQFSSEFNWGIFDFVVVGILLFGTGLLIEFVLRTVKKFEHRLIICAGILAVLALIWIEIAVGLFGTPIAGS